jgi:hypothetical protein
LRELDVRDLLNAATTGKVGPMEVGVHLTTVSSQGEADVICSLLRAAGIKC